MIGDPKGFHYLIRNIQRVLQTAGHARLTVCEKVDNSMRVLILPAQQTAGKAPHLKFIERVTTDRGHIKMELVIIGNASGYKHLMNAITRLIRSPTIETTDHMELNEWSDGAVERGSISLNVRATVQSFSSDALAELAPLVLQPNATKLPEGVSEYRDVTDKYEIPSPMTSKHIRLPGYKRAPHRCTTKMRSRS